MKTDINTILKKGASTKVKIIDYGSLQQKKKLLALKKRCEVIESNKNANWEKLSNTYITI